MVKRRKTPVIMETTEPHLCSTDLRLTILHSVPFFAGLPHETIARINQLFHEKGYDAGETIYVAGDPAQSLMIIAEGRVKLLRHTSIGKDILLDLLIPGECFGTLSTAAESEYQDTAVAMTSICALAIEYEKFRKEIQPAARKEGKRVGIGVVAFTEGTAVGPYEGCKITVSTSGKVTMTSGYSTQGQAHQTVFAQIIADQLNVKVEDVRVVTGDTNQFAWGAGTFASRGAALVGAATYLAAQKVRAKILSTASKKLEVPEEELDLCEGSVCVKGQPETTIPLGMLAVLANPMRGVVEPGVEPGLEATAYYGPPHGSTGCGAMGVIVSIDEETCKPVIERMVMVDDCGTMINPLIVDGQLQGGISMGIGNTLYERLVYDENGQLVTASFMDYLMPQATDMPAKIEMGHNHTKSPLNPLGIKGVGEAGALPPPPAFAQAFDDAFQRE